MGATWKECNLIFFTDIPAQQWVLSDQPFSYDGGRVEFEIQLPCLACMRRKQHGLQYFQDLLWLGPAIELEIVGPIMPAVMGA
jgi:hypothetical protein